MHSQVDLDEAEMNQVMYSITSDPDPRVMDTHKRIVERRRARVDEAAAELRRIEDAIKKREASFQNARRKAQKPSSPADVSDSSPSSCEKDDTPTTEGEEEGAKKLEDAARDWLDTTLRPHVLDGMANRFRTNKYGQADSQAAAIISQILYGDIDFCDQKFRDKNYPGFTIHAAFNSYFGEDSTWLWGPNLIWYWKATRKAAWDIINLRAIDTTKLESFFYKEGENRQNPHRVKFLGCVTTEEVDMKRSRAHEYLKQWAESSSSLETLIADTSSGDTTVALPDSDPFDMDRPWDNLRKDQRDVASIRVEQAAKRIVAAKILGVGLRHPKLFYIDLEELTKKHLNWYDFHSSFISFLC